MLKGDKRITHCLDSKKVEENVPCKIRALRRANKPYQAFFPKIQLKEPLAKAIFAVILKRNALRRTERHSKKCHNQLNTKQKKRACIFTSCYLLPRFQFHCIKPNSECRRIDATRKNRRTYYSIEIATCHFNAIMTKQSGK